MFSFFNVVRENTKGQGISILEKSLITIYLCVTERFSVKRTLSPLLSTR